MSIYIIILGIYIIGFASSFILQIILINRYTAIEIYNTEKRELQAIGFVIVLVFWLLFMVRYVAEQINGKK